MFNRKSAAKNDTVEEVIVENTAAPLPENNTAEVKLPAPANDPTQTPSNANDLERLRDILFGTQTRGTEKRLEDLEIQLASLRRELTDLIHEQVKEVGNRSSSQTTAVHKELTERGSQTDKQHSSQLRQVEQKLTTQIEGQKADQSDQLRNLNRDLTARLDNQESDYNAKIRSLNQEMNERLDEMTDTFLNQVRQTYNELNEQINQLRQEKTEQLNALQGETRQLDNKRRQELLSTAGGLDHKKVSRHQMAQLFVEIAQRLSSEE